MSDRSIYSIDRFSQKDEGLSVPLTKTAHRNPDIHQRGDALPESLLEYQEGSASLFPDVAGNQPVMVRSRQTVLGTGAFQVLTTTLTQMGVFTIIVTCPPQAVGSPFVELDWSHSIHATKAAGATFNDAWSELHVSGVFQNGTRQLAFLFGGIPGQLFMPITKAGVICPINPGATLIFQIMTRMLTNTTPEYTYNARDGADESYFSSKLWY